MPENDDENTEQEEDDPPRQRITSEDTAQEEEPTFVVPPDSVDESVENDHTGGSVSVNASSTQCTVAATVDDAAANKNHSSSTITPSQKQHRGQAKLAKLHGSNDDYTTSTTLNKTSSELRGQAKLVKWKQRKGFSTGTGEATRQQPHDTRTASSPTGAAPLCRRGQAKLNKLEDTNEHWRSRRSEQQRQRDTTTTTTTQRGQLKLVKLHQSRAMQQEPQVSPSHNLQDTTERGEDYVPGRRLGDQKDKEGSAAVLHRAGEEAAIITNSFSQAHTASSAGMEAPLLEEQHELNPPILCTGEDDDSTTDVVTTAGAVRVRQNGETGSIQATPLLSPRQQQQQQPLSVGLADDDSVSEERYERQIIHAPAPPHPPGAENLARANLIIEDEEGVENLPVAEEFVHDHQQGQPKHRGIVYFGLGLLLVVGVPLFIFFLVVRNNSSSSTDNSSGGTKDGGSSSAGMEEMDVQDYVLALLPHYTVAKIDTKNQTVPPTPQTQAFQWILNDPSLSRYPDWRIIQRFSLSTLFFATDGENWHKSTDWLSYDVDETYWHSQIHFEQGDVVADLGIDVQNLFEIMFEDDGDEMNYLFLAGNGLNGELPEEFYLLSSLRMVDLQRNKQLVGTLSSQIKNLQKLEIFSVMADGFTGTIPTELGALPYLVWLHLLGNYFTGTIPKELGETNLWFLSLDSNQLTGQVPSELGLMTYVLHLSLFDNFLASTLPSEIGHLTSLNVLYLFGTGLTGTIPPELFNAFGKLELTAYVEAIGSLHPAFAALMRAMPIEAMLEAVLPGGSQLVVNGNQLGGPLPTQAGLVDTLAIFDAHSNQLTGPIPTQLGGNEKLQLLALYDNSLSGTLPSQLGSLPYLVYLALSENLLTGSIPNELVQLSKLNLLWMADNSLSSTIPSGLDTLFAGAVPPCCEVESVPSLGAELDLSRNILSGPFPRSVGPKLVRLAVESNRLNGTIAGDLGRNGWLARVDAGYNLITGTLPSEIATWPALTSFNVTSNLLRGLVPSEISELLKDPSSIMFDLSNNSFDSLP